MTTPPIPPTLGLVLAGGLARRIGFMLDLAREAAFRRLRRHLEHVAVDVEFPAVIEAAEPAILVAREHERGTPVRTQLVKHAKPSLAVAEDDEVFAQQPHLDGRAIRLSDLFRQAGGNPMPPHDLSHGRRGFDAA